MKAYYLIGGITPVHQLIKLFEQNKDRLKYDGYSAKECERSNFSVFCEVEDFAQAKTFFDRITAFLWETIWKDIEGGYSTCGCCNEDDEEVEDEEGRDYTEWEKQQA